MICSLDWTFGLMCLFVGGVFICFSGLCFGLIGSIPLLRLVLIALLVFVD